MIKRLQEISESVIARNANPDGSTDPLNPELKALALCNLSALITEVIDLARAGCKAKASSFDDWQDSLDTLTKVETSIKTQLALLLKGVKVDAPTLKMLMEARAQDVQDTLKRYGL